MQKDIKNSNAIKEHLMIDETAILSTKLFVSPTQYQAFSQWQGDYNAAIALFPGFISLEILSPVEDLQAEWLIIQRFKTNAQLTNWCASEQRLALIEAVKNYLVQKDDALIDEIADISKMKGGVTEIFITKVALEKDTQYRDWMAKIHQIETKFPGFRGTYIQSPSEGQGEHWITMLQFDTSFNLDRWLESNERKEMMAESESMIFSLERHRVISPYAGWFKSVVMTENSSVLKQTMLVLLVLFPIVMLELKYLSPLLTNFDSSIATFVGNTLSVALISWPMMPIVIKCLKWWLSPNKENRLYTNLLGTLLVLALYSLEIAIFWNFKIK